MDRARPGRVLMRGRRMGLGLAGILALIMVWAVIVASLAGPIGSLPILVQAVIYLAAGIVWIFPLRPLLRWMETGQWR